MQLPQRFLEIENIIHTDYLISILCEEDCVTDDKRDFCIMLQESLLIPNHWEWVCKMECDIGKYTFLYVIGLL